tara:strand:+ start:1052 stop:1735 length:684 start_codon:yes stop_codon:yes gene_type:complete
MLLEVGILILAFVVYFLIYVEIKVNKNNDVYFYDEGLTKKSLSNETMLKIPFFFEAPHINPPVLKSNLTVIKKDKKNKYKKIISDREAPKLLQPYLRHKTEINLFCLKKKGEIPYHTNNNSVNYFVVRKGNIRISLVHPKYKDNFENNCSKEYIWNNPLFKYLDCQEGHVIYVPNHWFVSIKNVGHDKNDDSSDNGEAIVEKISFITIVRSLLNFVNKQFNYNKLLI